jgi:hypothetical protein
MTGVTRKAALLVALGLVVASAALAGVPSAATSIITKTLVPLAPITFIDVVGQNGVVDPFGKFYVIVKDIGGNLLAGRLVTVDFINATDIRLLTTQVPAGQTNTCNKASVISDINGVAQFTIGGGAKDFGGLNTVTDGVLNSIVVAADGFVIGYVAAAVYDLNGALGGGAGVSSTDGSILSTDNGVFGGPGNPLYKARCDYNHDGFQSSLDGSLMSTLRGFGSSAGAGGTYCP